MSGRNFAVVTPYYRESRATLERCIQSVKGQTLATDHFLIADGFPQDWIDAAQIRHIKLDAAHRDYGNVARGLGGLLAVSENYDGIGFLDADNWLDPTHTETCAKAGAGGGDVVIAKRRLVRPDGSEIVLAEQAGLVDTNCWWFRSGSYHLIAHWVTMPREVSSIGDRVFVALMEGARLRIERTAAVTVNYTCLWESVYRWLGETPPEGAKPDIDMSPVVEWLRALPEDRRRIVAKLSGGDLLPWAERLLAQIQAARARL